MNMHDDYDDGVDRLAEAWPGGRGAGGGVRGAGEDETQPPRFINQCQSEVCAHPKMGGATYSSTSPGPVASPSDGADGGRAADIKGAA